MFFFVSRLQFKPINQTKSEEGSERRRRKSPTELVWFAILNHYCWHSFCLIFLPNFLCFQSLDELQFEHVLQCLLNSSINKQTQNLWNWFRVFYRSCVILFIEFSSKTFIRSYQFGIFILRLSITRQALRILFWKISFYLVQLPLNGIIFVFQILKKKKIEEDFSEEFTWKRSVWMRNSSWYPREISNSTRWVFSFAWSRFCRRRLISFV